MMNKFNGEYKSRHFGFCNLEWIHSDFVIDNMLVGEMRERERVEV